MLDLSNRNKNVPCKVAYSSGNIDSQESAVQVQKESVYKTEYSSVQ